MYYNNKIIQVLEAKAEKEKKDELNASLLQCRQELKSSEDAVKAIQSDLLQQRAVTAQAEGQLSAKEKAIMSMRQEATGLQVQFINIGYNTNNIIYIG